MSDNIIEVAFDRYRPRKPALSKHQEIVLAADISILEKIEQWARARRELAENTARPLHPDARRKALKIDDIIYPPPPRPK